jgi:adenosylhomocysteine nucleosidase
VPTAAPPSGIGVVCALEAELGSLAPRVRARHRVQGLDLLELDASTRVLACVAGIGKVRAAHAAAALVAAGAQRALLVVGTCGSLSRGLAVGHLVHCTAAIQVDLAVRSDREFVSDSALRRAWLAVAGGSEAAFLTADRPVLSPWRRLRHARLRPGPCIADMETAAVAVVANAAGVPWAALRAVTDGAGLFSAREFRRHYPTCAGLAADTVERLVASDAFPCLAPRGGAR